MATPSSDRHPQVRADELPEAKAIVALDPAFEPVLCVPPPAVGDLDGVSCLALPRRRLHPGLIEDIVDALKSKQHEHQAGKYNKNVGSP